MCYPYMIYFIIFSDNLPKQTRVASLNFGIKLKRYYPKVMVYHIALETCKSFKGDVLLHVRVTHDDVWKKIQKNVKSDKKD